MKEENKTFKADYKKAIREKTVPTRKMPSSEWKSLENLQTLAEQENKPAGSARGK